MGDSEFRFALFLIPVVRAKLEPTMTFTDILAEGVRKLRASRSAIIAGLLVAMLGVASGVFSVPTFAAGGNGKSTNAASGNGINAQKIQKRIDELEQGEQSDAVKSELAALRQALTFVQQAATAEQAAARFASQAVNAPAVVKELETELAAPFKEPDLARLTDLSLEPLTAELEAASAQLEVERAIRVEVDQDAQHRNERRQKTPDELARLREQLAELKASEPPAAKGNAGDFAAALRWLRDAERQYLEARSKELEQELRSYDARRDLLRLRRQLAEKRVLQAERHFTVIEFAVSTRRARAAEESRRAAEEQRRKAADAHPAVRRAAEENESMATTLTDFTDRSKTLAAQKQSVDARLQRLRKAFNGAREKVEQVGLTDAIGIHLRNQRLQLPDDRTYSRSLTVRSAEMNAVQLRRIELEDILVDLIDVDAQVSRRLAEFTFESPEQRDQVEKSVAALLRAQRDDYAPALAKTLDIYFDEILVPLHDSERQLLETTRQYRDFIDERVLWVQSTHALGLADLVSVWDSVYTFVVNSAWARLAQALAEDIVDTPVLWLLFVGAVAGHVSQRKRIRQALHAAGDRAKRKFKARLLDTFAATVYSVLAIVTIPLGAAFLAWRVGVVADGPLAIAVSDALARLAVWCVMPLFLQQLVRVNGIAESHFRWSEHAVQLLRRQLKWYVPVGMTLYVLAALTFEQPLGALRDSFGRLTFIALMGATLVFAYRALHPSQGLFKNLLAEYSGGWLDKLRYVWYPLLLAVPLSMMFAVSIGYVYTATNLQQQFFFSAALVLAVIFCREYALRWLELEQRRMALDQARRRFAAMTKAREEGATDASTGELPVPEAEINVAAVSAQTQKLVNSVAWIAVILGAILIWKDVLPAFGFLGEVTLWSETVAVASGATGETIQRVEAITLGDLLLGLTFLVVAILVSQNIPGLLEIVVLQHLPLTPSARYAVTTVVRYAFVIVGVFMAFGAIGVGWSKVQWLAAAITVGLGFGLQEIFANFVSGLIILFERPIRVGDAVTVGDVSGKVTRIRMRATTILDWNRKELIIPNKTFVTGQVINWSLSDTILRVPIRIGVAYGSDTELVAKMLVDIAKRHPTVLTDPPPTAFFVAFGASSLDFDLRVFVPTPDDTFNVRHDLLIAIDKAFKEAGIEIAFPQRDLHIRSIDDGVLRRLRPGA